MAAAIEYNNKQNEDIFDTIKLAINDIDLKVNNFKEML